jgi:hypothetical protein
MERKAPLTPMNSLLLGDNNVPKFIGVEKGLIGVGVILIKFIRTRIPFFSLPWLRIHKFAQKKLEYIAAKEQDD